MKAMKLTKEMPVSVPFTTIFVEAVTETRKMFNMEQPALINQIVRMFFGLGLWDIQDGTKKGKIFCAIALKIFHILFYALFVTSIVVKAIVTEDSDEFVFLTTLSIIGVVHVIRLMYIVLKKSETIELLGQIGSHITNNTEEMIQVNNKKILFIKFAKTFIAICISEVSMVIFIPALRANEETVINIAFPLKYGRNVFLAKQVFILTGGIYSILCVLQSILIWYLMVNGAIKYEILGDQLRSLGNINTKDLTKDSSARNKMIISKTCLQTMFLRDLIKVIETHQKINHLMVHFSMAFSKLFFIQVLTSSISIATFTYILAFSSHSNLAQDCFFGVMLLYNLFDIFMVMYLGNEIKLTNRGLSNRLFESKWIEQTQQCKTYIIILTEILKYPRELKVGKLYPLNLQTFTSIVNAAYSMFNLLQNLRQ